MKQRKMYNISCSGVVMIVFTLLGIGVSAGNEVVTRVSDNQGEAQTTTVIADVTESYDDINATTEKIEETKECFTETTTMVQTTITNIETTYEIRTEELITEEMIFEDVEVTTEEVENEIAIETETEETEEPEEQEETETTTTIDETQEDGLYDCLVIDWQEIPIVRLPATQKNIDNNDVVLDTNLWSTERNLFFFGHSVKSFAFLHWVNVGDVIKFFDGYEEKLYVVERSERGDVTEDGSRIVSCVDDAELVYTDFGYESIRLITCYGTVITKKRWVVIARKI